MENLAKQMRKECCEKPTLDKLNKLGDAIFDLGYTDFGSSEVNITFYSVISEITDFINLTIENLTQNGKNN